MALTNSIETPDGISHPNAYAVLTYMESNWITQNIRFVINTYHSQQTYLDSKASIANRTYRVSKLSSGNIPAFDAVDGPDLKTNIMALIKSLPEWAGWTDA